MKNLAAAKAVIMLLVLERRPERARWMILLSPLIALFLTALVGAAIFALRGLDPLAALYVYFIEPLTTLWSLEQLLVKAAPLVLIGVGLSICYIGNVWNIGAEGQFTLGAVFGSMLPVYFPQFQSPAVLPLMLIMGILGGMLYGSIPAYLKNRFNANEILTSLMLVYVAGLFLDWLVRGPWRDPQGFNFPKTVTFEGWQILPTIGSTVHIGVPLAFLIALGLAFVLHRTLKGFEIRVLGSAPRAGTFAGFSRPAMVMFCFLLSGGLAGLAGICEVASTVGQLQPSISPGYGFTAIIVAFLGRLNPLGVIFAGLILALSYMGGEAAQVTLGISDKIARVFQGILLFFILACDTFILYRLRFALRPAAAGMAPAE
jgi:general nucleoside transport system permease protein